VIVDKKLDGEEISQGDGLTPSLMEKVVAIASNVTTQGPNGITNTSQAPKKVLPIDGLGSDKTSVVMTDAAIEIHVPTLGIGAGFIEIQGDVATDANITMHPLDTEKHICEKRPKFTRGLDADAQDAVTSRLASSPIQHATEGDADVILGTSDIANQAANAHPNVCGDFSANIPSSEDTRRVENDFHSLPRRTLQALSKQIGIKANMSNADMADALQSLEIVFGIEMLSTKKTNVVSVERELSKRTTALGDGDMIEKAKKT
jgi:hypothetical protein